VISDVVVVTASLSIDGGSSKVALTSALALAGSGVRVPLFTAFGLPSADLASCERLRVISTGQAEALNDPNRFAAALRGLWNFRAYRMMRDALAKLDRKRTIVHVHGWTKALSASVIAASVASRFPLVVTLHEYFTACPTGCLYLHRDNKVCTIKPMSPACIVKDCDSRSYIFKLYRVVRQWIAMYAAGVPWAVANFITVSLFSRKVMEPLLPSGKRFYPIDNPVDVAMSGRVTAEENARFVYIGRLSAEKGVLLLAEAARRADVSVEFVGDGELRGEIERINPEAAVTGWLDPAAVARRLQGARCVVVPSLWYETLGLVVLEGAGAGIPAVVPNDTAVRDLVAADVSGLVFERGDVDRLTAALIALKSDSLVRRLSEGAYRSYWRQPRTMSAHVTALQAAYEDILESGRAS